MTSTVERARGRWREILPALGVSPRFLVNKHGPCPICGGADRYRFDDRDGEGSYYCNQCGAGVGLILIRKLFGWTHRQACDEVDKIIGTEHKPPAPQTSVQSDDTAKIRAIEQVLREADAPEVVTAHLESRGLSVKSSVLLGHRNLAYFDEGSRRMVGRFPAIVAPITAADGKLVSAHRIWRKSDVGDKNKKLMPVPFQGALNGAAVRLFECDEELAVSEGIETGLAVHELYRLPVWATISAGGLKAFQPPQEVRRLHVFADHDRSFVGQAAAFDLAKRLGQKIEAIVNVPDLPGTDWLDVLNARAMR